MKTKVLFIVALISVVFLSSCSRDLSADFIGSFKVVNKEKSNPIRDYGFVTLVNSHKDTLKVYVGMEEEYLNVKIGGTYSVGKTNYGFVLLNNKPERGVVGYAKILQKKIDKGILKCKVITSGQDTISVGLVSDVVFYNVSEGDSILVEKNSRGNRDKPHYFVE